MINKIRFNSRFLPYVWIRVPKPILKWAEDKFDVDTWVIR